MDGADRWRGGGFVGEKGGGGGGRVASTTVIIGFTSVTPEHVLIRFSFQTGARGLFAAGSADDANWAADAGSSDALTVKNPENLEMFVWTLENKLGPNHGSTHVNEKLKSNNIINNI